MRLRPSVMLITAALSACATPPNYAPPKVPGAEAAWIAPASPGAVAQDWWKTLGDPQLDALIDAALKANLDIREAEAKLREARANQAVQDATKRPSVNATGYATATEVSRNGQILANNVPGFQRQYGLFDLGFDASWELDIWGGNARLREASGARATASAARFADMRLQIMAEVARNYANLRGAQARAASIADDAQIQAEIAALMQKRFAAGAATRIEALNAVQRADAVRAALPGAQGDARAAIYQLALLTGQAPEALLAPLQAVAPLPVVPEIIATGIRADLLTRRADVRAAEADLAAATGDLGAQKTNLFPKFSLTANVGQQARSLGDFLSPSSTRGQFGPSFSWPIFSAGSVRAQINAAGARLDQATARYEKAVLTALSDSETALNRFAAAQAVQRARAAALTDNRSSVALVLRRYRAGEDDRIIWLEARSAERATEQQAIAAQNDALTSYVSVAKALGGGWTTTGTAP